MAMDVNWIYLNLVQRAEHICNNKCFICHRVGCSTRNHPRNEGSTPTKTYTPHNQRPHNICNTNTAPIPNLELPHTQPIDKVASYLNVMHTNRNLSNQDVLCSLQIINSLDEQGKQMNTIHLDKNPQKDF